MAHGMVDLGGVTGAHLLETYCILPPGLCDLWKTLQALTLGRATGARTTRLSPAMVAVS